jgi:predicted porin
LDVFKYLELFMKKSLIALAVLAASGASFAQSTVSLYGIADVWMGRSTATGATTQTKIESGGVSGSRFGFKGTEDLGGGLKANFVLEQGFTIDNGAQKSNNVAFSRQAFVGFSGAFGEARIGKTFTAFDDILGGANSAFDSKLSAQNNVWATVQAYNDQANNALYYATPTISGFKGAVSYSLNEDAVTNGAAATSTSSLNGTYAAGPLYVGVAFQSEKASNAPVVTSTANKDFTTVNASYDLGVAKLLAGYGRAVVGSGAAQITSNDYQVGVDYPVSAALVLSGGVARSLDNDTVGTARTGYGFAAAYSLSKRTTVYGGYQHNTQTATGAADVDKSLLAAGVKHTF